MMVTIELLIGAMYMRTKTMILLPLFALSFSYGIAGDYVDVGSFGNTTDVQSTADQKDLELARNLQNPTFRKKYMKEQVQEGLAKLYQVSTPELKVGPVETKEIKRDIPQNVALVGCDEMSKKWLRQNAQQLSDYKPMVYVVNCDSKKQFDELKAVSNLPMMAINGSEFAKLYNLKHYPVLLTKDLVTQ